MKIIFLDFDGVIRVPVFTGGDKPEAEFSVTRKQRLADLAEKHEAKIVISSDWRLRKSREEIVNLLGSAIPETSLHPDWRTPSLALRDTESEKAVPRGLEILMWLHSNREKIERFIMIDDYPAGHFPFISDRLVRCTLIDGFTEERYGEADRLLANSSASRSRLIP